MALVRASQGQRAVFWYASLVIRKNKVMNDVGNQLNHMAKQSITVFKRPSVTTFEPYGRGGTLREAALYVGSAALGCGILAGLTTGAGIGGAFSTALNVLLGFIVFTAATFWLGQRQGSPATMDDVAYSFSLFWGPIAFVAALISLVVRHEIRGLLELGTLAAQIYFASLVLQTSSFSFTNRNKLLMTLGFAGILTAIVTSLI